MFNGVSTNGTSLPIVQIGSGSVSTTGYSSETIAVAPTAVGGGGTYIVGFPIIYSFASTFTLKGTMTLTSFSNRIWTSTSQVSYVAGGASTFQEGISPTLPGTLDRIRITTVNGTDVFDAGSVNVLYDLDIGTISTAINIAGGAFGSIPYQTAEGATSLLAYGLAGQVLTCNGGSFAPTWTNLPTGNANPNYLINGGFQVAQSATSATIFNSTSTPTASLGYPVLDSWFCYSVGGNPTLAKISGSGSTANVLQLTGASSITSVGIGQRIEAINTTALSSKNVTLSFTCSNSLLGSLTITANRPTTTANTFGTIGTPTKTLISTTSLTINSTLNRYFYTFTCPAQVNLGLEILFTLGAQISGTFVLSNVKLEEGTTATSFVAAPYLNELTQCQRYFRNLTDYLYSYYAAAGTLNSQQIHTNMFGTTRIRNLIAGNGFAGTTVSLAAGTNENSTQSNYANSLAAGYYGGAPVYTVSAYIP